MGGRDNQVLVEKEATFNSSLALPRLSGLSKSLPRSKLMVCLRRLDWSLAAMTRRLLPARICGLGFRLYDHVSFLTVFVKLKFSALAGNTDRVPGFANKLYQHII